MGPLPRRDSTRARKVRSSKSAVPRQTGSVTPPAGTAQLPRRPPIDAESLRIKLSVAVSVVNVCVAALEAQAAHRDLDAAEALQRCVSDPLWEQIQQLDRLIARGES